MLRRCPNPRRTQSCVLETLYKSSGYAILQIAEGRRNECGIGLVTAKQEDTAAHVVALSILLLNLGKI